MKCKACDKDIVFLKTGAGKLIPVDKETVVLDRYDRPAEMYDPAKHVTHFITCPSADQFRKKRNG